MSNLDKTPYEMRPGCLNCILGVSYRFIEQGLRLEKYRAKLAKLKFKLTDELDENLKAAIRGEIAELTSKIEEKERRQWMAIKKLFAYLSEEISEHNFAVILASKVFNKIKELTDNPDPWRDIKAVSNLICLNVDQDVRKDIFAIRDPKQRLRTALIYSALANTLDFGTAMHKVDLRFNFMYLKRQLEEFNKRGFGIDDFDLLYKSLMKLASPTKSTLNEEEFGEESGEELPGIIGEEELENVDTEEDGVVYSDDDIDDFGDDVDNLLGNEESVESYIYDEDTEIEESEDTVIPEDDEYVEPRLTEDQMASSVVILLDNSGEIVFDKILIEVLIDMGIPVIAVVKGGPVSNDATIEDAVEIDLTSICPVITTGSSDLGFNPHNASEQFRTLIKTAPVIIAKGQANFESINTFREYIVCPEIFLLAKFKCNVNAYLAGVNVGDYVIWKMQ